VLPTRNQPPPSRLRGRGGPICTAAGAICELNCFKLVAGSRHGETAPGVDARPEVLPIARSRIRTLTGAHRFGPRTHRDMLHFIWHQIEWLGWRARGAPACS
jgi:hypothetical protein